MASKSLTFDIFGRDRSASKAIKGVGASAQSIQGTFLKLGSVIAGAFAVRQVIQFGTESVRAFAEAEKSQMKLSDAYSRFPALADTNIDSMRALAKAQQQKSRFDDDAIVAGQAQLAQYGLTGAQLKKLTPLLVDYAAKTGKDVAGASEDLGKALLGQGRALKEVGIDFKDTGSVAGNFDSLMGSLSAQVGGFAQKDLTTAEGKLENLQNKFGDIQEDIGEAFLPALESVSGWLDGEGMEAITGFVKDGIVPAIEGFTGMVDWIVKYKDILAPAATAVGVLTAAMWLFNAAAAANPIGAVILALEGLILMGTAVVTNFGGVGSALSEVFWNVQGTVLQVARNIAGFFEGLVNTFVNGLNAMLGPLNDILKALGLGPVKVGKVDFTSGLDSSLQFNEQMRASTRLFYAGGVATPSTGGLSSSSRTTVGGERLNVGMMADGGIVRKRPGGSLKVIGEGKWDEAVVPLSPQVLSQLGGGKTITINASGVDPHIVVKLLEQRLRFAF